VQNVLALFISAVFGSVVWAQSPTSAQLASSAPASVTRQMQSPPSLPNNTLAPYEERLANAKSVKVKTSLLGIELGSSLERAHEKLDHLCDAAHRPKEEKEEEGEGEHKVLWEMANGDYAFVFVKADDKERITYLSGFLRPGKEIPFDKIGETKKAPVQDSNTIAWDVARPKHPLFRVVAAGAERKANNIMIFLVKRPSLKKYP
jgi:putative alpha-1,2-mannosidase